MPDSDAAAWIAQLRDRIEPHEGGTPQFRLGLWRATFTTPTYAQLFEPQDEQTFAYPLVGTRQLVVDRACSKSYASVLPPDEKQRIREAFRRYHALTPDERKAWRQRYESANPPKP